MKKTIIFLSLLSLTFLLGCQESYKKKNIFLNSVSGEAVVQRDNAKQPHIKTDYSKIKDRKIKMSDVQGITEKMVYRERERRQGEQCYYDKETQNEFYLYEEEGDGARFVTYRGGCQLFGNAKKTAEGKYRCYVKRCSDETRPYRIAQQGEYTLDFWLEGDELVEEVTAVSDDLLSEITGKKVYKKGKIPKKLYAFQLENCVDDYFKVRKSIYARENYYSMDFGKEPGSKRLSYIEVNDSGDILGSEMRGITFFSTKEECDRILGTPLRVTNENRVYKFNDDYEIEIEYDVDTIKKMGIYLENKETATQTYQVGDFTMRGCQIVKYNHAYEKEGQVKLPKDIVSFEDSSFTVVEKFTDDGYRLGKKHSQVKKVKLCIPRQVYIEPYAFRQMGKAEIIFEEGREEIETSAFSEIGCENFKVKIILPSTIKRLNLWAFKNDTNARGITLILNEGLRVIGNGALEGMKVDLPKSLRILEDGALTYWKPKGDFGLPEGVEEIGNSCFYFENAKEAFKIPSTVKKIGKNAFDFSESVYVPEVKADPANPYFKSDENGWLYSKDGKTLYYAWVDSKHDKIPESVVYLKCDVKSYPD